MQPEEILFRYFGYKSFRNSQREIINAILKGENVLAVLPTGAGKSVCYQIPSLLSENFSIVISPLIALMKDQVDSLNKQEKIAAFINSSMDFYESEQVLQDIAYGKIKILYAAPERLENLNFAERIKKLNPNYLFIDEAHCISNWGHSFRPSYRKIKEFADYIAVHKISAFTATATPEVVKDIVSQLDIKDPKIFVRGFERENLRLNVLITKKKKEKCLELISIYKTPAIIYTASRKKSEEIAEYLNMHRINACYYHAGLEPTIRKKIQEDFINDKVPIIAATNAFGMGIDKKDIRLLIHFNTPGSIENYYQEIGRAGRDGNISNIFLLHDDSDINIQNYFLANSHPDRVLIENIYNAICDYGQIAEGILPEKEIPVNLEYISAYCKKPLTRGLLYSVLKILEGGNYLKQLSEFDRKISFKFILEKEKLKDFVKRSANNNLKEITLLLLREYGNEIFTSKISIPIAQLSQKLGLIEPDIDESLIILENLGIISYNKITSKENIILTSPRTFANRLNFDYKKINENYLHLQKKIDLMVDYAYSGDCRFKFILNYFGEDLPDYKCGKCDRCTLSIGLSESAIEYIKEIILRTINESGGLMNETTLLRVIKGSGRRDAYSRFAAYGTCSNYEKNDLKFVLHELLNQKLLSRKNINSRIIELTGKGFISIPQNEAVENNEQVTVEYEQSLYLYNLLREARQKTAKKFMQSGYLICPDEVLRNISFQKPNSRSELLSVNGFSGRMFNKIGDDFLSIISQFLNEKGEKKEITKDEERVIPQNIVETNKLLKKGYSLKDIAALRKLSEAVISMQIETIIEYKQDADVAHLFKNDLLEKIFIEIEKGFSDLKDLKQRLPEEATYPLIRIASAKYKFNRPSHSLNFPDALKLY